MIEINADSCNFGNGMKVEVNVKIDAVDKKRATEELFSILKTLDERVPEILMDAVDMHIKNIIKECNEVGEDD